MERRNFLRGLVLGAGAAAGTALVKLPSVEEVARFTKEPEVVIGPQLRAPAMMPGPHWLNGPIYVETERGFEPIGYITGINIKATVEELFSWDGSAVFVPGLKRATGTFRGPF